MPDHVMFRINILNKTANIPIVLHYSMDTLKYKVCSIHFLTYKTL